MPTVAPSTDIVLPGHRLGLVTEYQSGEGTFVRQGQIYASRCGHRVEEHEQEGKAILRVERKKEGTVVPEVGSIVTGKITRVSRVQANVAIMIVGAKPCLEDFAGIIRQPDIRATEKDQAKVYNAFRPGDIVRAEVISLGDAKSYYLSTAKNELGVIFARSVAALDTLPPTIQPPYRLRVGTEAATLRFRGPLTGTQGEWLGVEWDDPSRGKHNGQHQGEQVFECARRHAKNASFLRWNAKKISLGRAFLDVLASKYKASEEEDQVLRLGGKDGVEVETVGFGKVARQQSQLQRLRIVDLSHLDVAWVDKAPAISNDCPNVQQLGLGDTLIDSWDHIWTLLSQLNRLATLRLNHLALPIPSPTLLAPWQPFGQLKHLSLVETGLSWGDAQGLSEYLPSLESLHLSCNNITRLSPIVSDTPSETSKEHGNSTWTNLTQLGLEENSLTDWLDVVDALGKLPKLSILLLSGNQIKEIEPVKGLFQSVFPALTQLHIDSNALQDFRSLDALDSTHAGGVREIRVGNNPCLREMEQDMIMCQVVSRIGSLQRVNGTTITARERADLERYYLRTCAVEAAKGGHSDVDTMVAAIRKNNPRWETLCEQHGMPDLQLSAPKDMAVLGNRLIAVNLERRMALDASPDTRIQKRILPTLTVRNTRNLVVRLLKLNPTIPTQLFLVHADTIEPLDDELKDLRWYDVQEGDTIVCLAI
ncbi:hypothetical protein BZG36_00065 [Bifiguratus adelaidae]|uniref:Tubulin-folding cofactor E n=1 Tax=Bifiguratus adelaidae TaxID=1938954 RepID=A0A261Y892_9FUNG|nr:hypothetical protein BZG36_00065 [Bifiguratus adelaidae]